MRLEALFGKIALLVTVVTGGPAYVPIFPKRWLIAATIISSRGLGCVDSSSRSGALKPGAAGPVIVTIPIVSTFLVALARSFQYLSLLGTMKRHSFCLLVAERKGASVPGVIFNRF